MASTSDYDGLPADPEIDPNADADSPESEPFVFDEDSPNLVEAFMADPKGEESLRKITAHAIRTFDADWESTEKYRHRVANDWRLFSGDLPPKDFPFKSSANAHVPVMLENLTRIVFRSFDELFSNWQNVFSVLPVGPDDQEVADLLTQHGNWQIREQISDFYRQMMRGMLLYFSAGDVVFHSYYDGFRKQNTHEVLSTDEFVVPYTFVSTRSDYSDVPHRSKILRKYRHELQAMRDVWSNVDEVIAREPNDWDDEPESLWRESQAQVQGVEPSSESGSAPYKLIWWEGWCEYLPNQDRDRFIQVIVDYTTRRPLSLVIHEEADWQEKLRFERQTQELANYRQASAEHAAVSANLIGRQQEIQQHAQLATDQGVPPHPGEVESLLSQFQPPPPPPTPGWLSDEHFDEAGQVLPDAEPEQPRKVPIHTFTHGVCIEPIVGNLGIGLGRIQADFNRALNVSLSQYIDSATLANAWGLITSGNLEFERPFSFGPGTVNIAKGVSGAQLKDSIFELKPGQANPQMIDLVDRLKEWSQASAQAPEVLSGQPGKSGETYRGIATRVEQATIQLSVPTRGFAIQVLTPVLKNNALLNSVFMPEEEFVYVNDHQLGHVKELQLGRKLYERDYRVQIAGDLRFASRDQRISEADELTQLPTAVPALASDLAFIYATVKKSLEARGRYDLVPLLGPPPPPPQTTFGVQPPAPPPPPGIQPPRPNGVPPQPQPQPQMSPVPHA